MGKLRFLVIFLLIFGLIAFGIALRNSSEAGDDNPVEFFAGYYYESDTYHTEILVTNNHLKVVHVDEQKLDKHWDENPHWTEDDLVTREKDIADDEIEELKNTIRNSDFFELKDVVGVAEEGFEYEASTLTVTFEGKTKTVEYRYREGGPDMPEAFDKISGILYNWAELGQ